MKLRRTLALGTIVLLAVQFAAAQTEQPATGAPHLELTKKCPNLRYVGRDATFELGLTNRGTGTALNVVVIDTLPAGVEFISADNDAQREGSNVVWRLGNLDAGQSRTLKINVRCNQITTVRNVAKVTYCAEAQAMCEFPVKGVAAILLECVDDPDPIEVNGQMTYTITVTNQGSETGTNIALECVLPAEEEFVKAGGATEGKADAKTVKFAPLPTLAPKAKAVWTVTVKGVKEGDARFRVNLTSDQIAEPVMETESTHIY
ncbi:MAG TPA: DUF11 domain-containing protein [Phycisphaerae bacterium]|nr:DUF11 domain-containing protein [Phycisphaerae bacterium]HPM24782.1 DUF11 domain-containing protein [Phycisphaerae bacterium]